MVLDIEIRKNLINNLSVGVVLVNQEGLILFANQAIKEMTGYTEKEIKTLADWYQAAYPDPKYRKKAKKHFHYDLENNITDRTYKIKTAAGDYKYFNFRYSKLESEQMLFEIIDISHRIKEKHKLENQKIIFENLFANSLEGIALLDQEFNIIDVNDKFEEIFELAKEDILNKYALEVVNLAEDNEEIRLGMKLIALGNEWENIVRFKVKDKIKYCNLHIFSVENEVHDQLTYIVVDDITESRMREKELAEVKERLELAVEGASIGVWDWDVEKERIKFNEKWADMLGYEMESLSNNLDTWLNLVHPDDKEQALNDIQDHLSGKTTEYFNEHRLKTKSGKWKWIRDIGRIIETDEQGNPLRIVGVHIDIDREKRETRKIEYLSNHDELTGLYNRRYLNDELKRLCDSRRYPISIIVGDLNGLKNINDSYGHLTGDTYIQLTAEAIKESLRTEDLAARVGGDEFAIILPETDSEASESIINRIEANLAEKNNNEDLPEPVSIALGYETADYNIQNCSFKSIEKLYNQADKKMYEQKFAEKINCKDG